MKKSTFLCALVVATFVIFMNSCGKDNTTNQGPVGNSEFAYSANGGSTINADSAYFTARYNTLIATKGGTTVFEINLNGSTAATYPISGSAVAVSYLVNNGVYGATSGSVIVSANTGNKISGSFSTTGSGAGITSASGTFTNIPVR